MKKIKLLCISFLLLLIYSSNSFAQDEPFISQIGIFPYNFTPKYWMPCDGRSLQIAQYSALFSLLGTTYGGDGRTYFNLPDLRGRIPMHMDQGYGLSYRVLGETGGDETATLTISNMPAHSHLINVSTAIGDTYDPNGKFLAKGTNREKIYTTSQNASMHAASTAITGNGTPFSLMNPYLVVNYCICVSGVYPARW